MQSWWLGLDRKELSDRAAKELPRMRRSKFGGHLREYVNWEREYAEVGLASKEDE